MSANPLFELTLSAGRFVVTHIEGSERIHAPFLLTITGWFVGPEGNHAEIDCEALLGSSARLTLHGAAGERSLAGVVDAIEALEHGYRLRVVPRLAALARAVNHQLFLREDTLGIVRAV